MFPGTFGYRTPEPRRHEERRGGRATARLREAYDGSHEDTPVLSADAVLRARERRARYATQTETLAWLEHPAGQVVAGLVVLLIAAVILWALGLSLVEMLG